ncbi:NAD dependent epimerase/dehydratase family protein [Aureobasidium sp. EXF-8845]|nr:NAD dependent epimerase/dehydratase family protein [Aureobasidium sp. EXF-8845]KAI4855900.1 NAD dependent epimerase/dehydratase family protein [Aureobasidium sp. EXF-8846]
MAESTVFITGATGFIGAQVTASALRAGYNVKLSVRRETQIDGLRQAFSLYPSALDFCVVPDYTTPEAFGTALQGVDYVIHVASPLPNGNEDLLTPAVKGTTSILEAASKVKEIRKVVVTASVASLVPLDKYVDGTIVTEDISTQDLEFDQSIVPSLDPGRQYRASKIASYLATLDFVSTRQPHFSVVTLHPVYVFGRNILQTSPDEISGTNKMLYNSLLSASPLFAPYRGVHVDDVASAHIKALTIPDAPVSSYLLSAKARTWEEVMEFAHAKFPGEKFETQPKGGDLLIVKTEKAEAELGFASWKEMEVQVADVIEQQIELRGGV